MIRLLALDIDGTLLDSTGQLPEANRKAIALAIDAGVEVALATGRRYDFARPIFEQLPGPLTLILSNGAVVKKHSGETMLRRLLPREVARQVLQAVPDYRHEAAVTFDRPREGQIIYQSIDWDHPQHHKFFAANRPYLAEMNPLEDCLVEDPVQVMFTGRCAEMRELFNELRVGARPGEPGAGGIPSAGARKAAALVDDGGGHRYSVALTEYEFRDFSLVDILQAGCSKGAALEDWARARGYAREEIMAVGDNLNDLEMLEFAGRAVVMGNGIADLKERGWTLTSTNDEAGVARAVETFVLGRAS
jgi:hydroxymethylpyrimidine pyrophosphatase-like HAD family hydrolase